MNFATSIAIRSSLATACLLGGGVAYGELIISNLDQEADIQLFEPPPRGYLIGLRSVESTTSGETPEPQTNDAAADDSDPFEGLFLDLAPLDNPPAAEVFNLDHLHQTTIQYELEGANLVNDTDPQVGESAWNAAKRKKDAKEIVAVAEPSSLALMASLLVAFLVYRQATSQKGLFLTRTIQRMRGIDGRVQ